MDEDALNPGASGEDVITVTFPEQSFSPVQFHSCRLGPYYFRTTVKKGETPEQAMERAQKFVDAHARKQWPIVMKEYLERMRELGTAARVR